MSLFCYSMDPPLGASMLLVYSPVFLYSWRDGKALVALVNSLQPGAVDANLGEVNQIQIPINKLHL